MESSKRIWGVCLLVACIFLAGCHTASSRGAPQGTANEEQTGGGQPQTPLSTIPDVNYRLQSFVLNEAITLSYRKWYAPDARAVIVYLSGLQSHSQWFHDAGDTLYTRGFNVYALDRRGSGLSGGTRGDIISAYTWIQDLHKFITVVREENPGLPIHLMANCFGTRIMLGYALQYPAQIDSLILLTPGIWMQVDLSAEDKMKVIAQSKEYIAVPIADAMYTADPEKLEFMAQDSHMLRAVSARLYMQGELLNAWVRYFAPVISTPMLVLMSADDEVIDTAKSVNDFYTPLTCRKELTAYPDVRHFLLFESCGGAVLDNIAQWAAPS